MEEILCKRQIRRTRFFLSFKRKVEGFFNFYFLEKRRAVTIKRKCFPIEIIV